MCSYKFAPNTPTHVITGWVENKAGFLQDDTKAVKGLAVFGLQAGVLTEDKLTNPIAEWLLTKDEFKEFIVKKEKGDK
jgi:hypothetical protein